MSYIKMYHCILCEGNGVISMKKLTFIEATMLVAGAGMGTGLLTIPYAADRVGLWGTVIALVVAYAVSLLLYLYIAELTLRSKESTQILGILKEHLFRGNHQKLLTGVFFGIFVIILLQNLIVYIICAGDILTQLFGFPAPVSKIVFYLLASSVLLFGIKGIGIGEKISVPLICAVILLLIGLSAFHVRGGISLSLGEPGLITAVFGLFMFAFSAIFSVVQVVNHIDDQRNIKKSLTLGLAINAGLTLLFTLAAMIGSEEVTPVATIGLTKAIGMPWVEVLCGVFVLLAMLTSYWSSGLAFADTLKDEFKMGKRTAWLLSTLPTILLVLILPLSVLDFVQIGAGALSIVVMSILLPAYHNAVKNADEGLLLGRLGKSRALLWLAGAFTLIMAISSLIPID